VTCPALRFVNLLPARCLPSRVHTRCDRSRCRSLPRKQERSPERIAAERHAGCV